MISPGANREIGAGLDSGDLKMSSSVQLREIYKYGLWANVVTIFLVTGLYFFRFGEIGAVVIPIIRGAVLMVPVAMFMGRKDPGNDPVDGAANSRFLLGLNVIWGASIFIYLLVGSRFGEFSWMLVVLGLWTGNKIGWLLIHSGMFRAKD